jgi:hypothetical protein
MSDPVTVRGGGGRRDRTGRISSRPAGLGSRKDQAANQLPILGSRARGASADTRGVAALRSVGRGSPDPAFSMTRGLPLGSDWSRDGWTRREPFGRAGGGVRRPAPNGAIGPLGCLPGKMMPGSAAISGDTEGRPVNRSAFRSDHGLADPFGTSDGWAFSCVGGLPRGTTRSDVAGS